MKKLLIIPFCLITIFSFSQARILSGFEPTTGMSGKFIYDTVRTLNLATRYIRSLNDSTIYFDSTLVITNVTKNPSRDSFYFFRAGSTTPSIILKDSTGGGGGGSGWSLTGNAGTVAGTNFLGTTNNIPLVFKVFSVYAGYLDTAGGRSLTAFGAEAGNPSSSTGINNSAFGQYALKSLTTGTNNLGIGNISLRANTSGIDNVGVGFGSLNLNTTGGQNVGIGSNSLTNNTSGGNNTAVGFFSLANNTAGNNNALGASALTNNTSGAANTALSDRALLTNTTGSENVAIGSVALASSNSSYNTSVGVSSLYNNNSGQRNTAIGHEGGYSNTTGSFNVYLGNFAGGYSTNVDNQIFLDNQNRGSYSADKSGAPFYAVANATVASQTVRLNGNVAINTDATSTLQSGGSFSTAYTAKTAAYTATILDYTINCTTGTFTVTLPTAVGIAGRIYVIKNTGTGVITVATTSSQTIDGATTKIYNTQYSGGSFQSDGANWIITGNF